MVTIDTENAKNLYGAKGSAFVKKYFEENLPAAEFVSDYEHSGFWGIKYFYRGAYIAFDADSGGIGYTITLDNEEIPLWKLDESVKDANRSNDRDILIALNAIKKYFTSEHNL